MMFRENIYGVLMGIFIGLSVTLKAQDTLYTQADQMPYFKSCEKMMIGTMEKRNCSNQALIAFIATHLETPKSDITGAVYVTFFINEAG